MPVLLKWQFVQKLIATLLKTVFKTVLLAMLCLYFVTCFIVAPVYTVQVVSTK